MAATVWRGQLTFALVSFPVRLFRAARAERVPLRRLQRVARPEPVQVPTRRGKSVEREEPAPTVIPTQNAIVTVSHPEPIPREQLVRGYEVSKDNFLTVEEEEIRALEPETSTEMQIVEFVKWSEIDPVYLETSYYLKPDEAGERPYALLFEAIRKKKYAALAEISMHRRQHVLILRPGESGIVAHTMFYPNEVRSDQEFRAEAHPAQKREFDLAERLIETMVVPFEPQKFRDTWRENLEKLIAGKKPTASSKPAASASVDILSALQKSLKSRAS